MALLDNNEINDLAGAIGGSGLDLGDARRVFIQGIEALYIGVLPHLGAGLGQLMADLHQMNNVERLTTGQVPLEIYLKNATLLFRNRTEEEIIRRALDKITHVASGTPRVAIKAPDILQQIIHRDDTVSYGFIQASFKAAPSTLKLKVPSYFGGQMRKMSNGQNMIFLGTGWLISRDLVVTNHHVINARKEAEPVANEQDLNLQANGSIGQFDYDAIGIEPIEVNFSKLEAFNQTLDYAIIRLQSPTDRNELVLNKTPVVVSNEPIPVNIIQHPNGQPKRYGIRNNLMHFADDVELRYFTDTDNGSSGSAVMDDMWTVVGLHRGASFVNNVQFQGKPTAYVNMGTQITAILTDIKARYSALGDELRL